MKKFIHAFRHNKSRNPHLGEKYHDPLSSMHVDFVSKSCQVRLFVPWFAELCVVILLLGRPFPGTALGAGSIALAKDAKPWLHESFILMLRQMIKFAFLCQAALQDKNKEEQTEWQGPWGGVLIFVAWSEKIFLE